MQLGSATSASTCVNSGVAPFVAVCVVGPWFRPRPPSPANPPSNSPSLPFLLRTHTWPTTSTFTGATALASPSWRRGKGDNVARPPLAVPSFHLIPGAPNSFFQFHNETVNVWSHFFGFLVFVVLITNLATRPWLFHVPVPAPSSSIALSTPCAGPALVGGGHTGSVLLEGWCCAMPPGHNTPFASALAAFQHRLADMSAKIREGTRLPAVVVTLSPPGL